MKKSAEEKLVAAIKEWLATKRGTNAVRSYLEDAIPRLKAIK